jgi:predicted anti-sigma-YlaC factor YlaD
MRCAEVREVLPVSIDGGEVSLAVRRHLAGCAGCRAELASYESLRSSLASLQAVTAEPPPGLERSILAIPSLPNRLETARAHVARNRRVYVGGLAVALAGAAGAAVWRARAREATA